MFAICLVTMQVGYFLIELCSIDELCITKKKFF